jgi:VPDSG-CTERM motif
MLIGPGVPNIVNIYTGLTGPTSFGSPAGTHFGAGSGDFFGIFSAPIGLELFVPALYGSGNALSANSTFFGSTFASLGVTPGTYVWTWGAGGANQNFTLQIGPAGVPDGGSTVSLLGCALLGLAALRWKLNR